MKQRFLAIITVIIVFIAFLPANAFAAGTGAGAVTVTASPTASIVLVDGDEVAFDAYNIDEFNYFKLRDLAYVLNKSAKQFEVGWDEANDTISLTSGLSYTVTGGEMTSKGSGIKNAKLSDSAIILDGNIVRFTAYNIENNNYFKLRDIGEAFNFGVGYDEFNDMIVINSEVDYTPYSGIAAPGIGVYPDIDGLTFADLDGIEFMFSSGVGAWATGVQISSDGSFEGHHHDTDMGDTGVGYPDGTLYYCDFSGKFTNLVKTGPYEYTMKCVSLVQEGTPGDVEILADMRYIVSEPYGFDSADVFYLYLPGKSVDGLPEQFIEWIERPLGVPFEKGDVLSFYCLYNAGGEMGFFS